MIMFDSRRELLVQAGVQIGGFQVGEISIGKAVLGYLNKELNRTMEVWGNIRCVGGKKIVQGGKMPRYSE